MVLNRDANGLFDHTKRHDGDDDKKERKKEMMNLRAEERLYGGEKQRKAV